MTRPARTLAVLAASHLALGLFVGVTDHDFSLLWFDAPFVVLTLGACGLVSLQRPLALGFAVALTAVALVLAVVTVPLYLLGLLHLPQAVAALVVTVRAAPAH